MRQKYFTKKNYKFFIVMRFILHRSIIPKMFLVNALLINEYSLEP
jgi:hypothetical protein